MPLPLRMTETPSFEFTALGDVLGTAFHRGKPALTLEMPWATFIASFQQAQQLMAARAEWELSNPPRDNVVRMRRQH